MPLSCVGDLVGSDDMYSFSTSNQLDEDLADAEALLRSRRDTCVHDHDYVLKTSLKFVLPLC